MEKDWKKEHWITQREEDKDMIPTGCSLCGCKILNEDKQGWRCNDCGSQINAISYYQGANAKARQLNEKVLSKSLQ